MAAAVAAPGKAGAIVLYSGHDLTPQRKSLYKSSIAFSEEMSNVSRIAMQRQATQWINALYSDMKSRSLSFSL